MIERTETFVVFYDVGGGYRWRLRAAGGETLAVCTAPTRDREAVFRDLVEARVSYPDAVLLDLTASPRSGVWS